MYHCFSAMGNTVDGKFAFGTWDPRCCYTPMMVLIDEAAGCEDEAACVAVPGREGFDGTWLNPTWLDGTCCIGYASSDADGASCTFKPPGAEESRLFEDEYGRRPTDDARHRGRRLELQRP